MAGLEILKYSMYAGAHLIESLSGEEIKKIKNVVLFGSVAMGTAGKESDVDIFFDADLPEKSRLALRSKLNKAGEAFYLTNKALEFKLNGIENELSIKIGRLQEWAGLAQSISSNGIILFQNYASKPSEAKAYTILSWEKIGKAKGAVLNRFYGYKSGKKFYQGLIKKSKGIKIGKGTIMVPAENRTIFIEILEKYKINYSRYDVWAPS